MSGKECMNRKMKKFIMVCQYVKIWSVYLVYKICESVCHLVKLFNKMIYNVIPSCVQYLLARMLILKVRQYGGERTLSL